jgi:Flp pilus assembly pilin Flp
VASFIQARLNTDERGAALVEYALLVALIAVVSIAILTTLGGGIKDKFGEVNSKLAS